MKELVMLKSFMKCEQALTTTLIVAEETGNQHESIVRLIQNHREHFERWGKIQFSDLKSGNPLGGRPTKFAYIFRS